MENKGGRPTKREIINKKIGAGVSKMSDERIEKLKHAFAIGANIKQACVYADISHDTYYNWIKKNPKLSEEFEKQREKLPLKAKNNIAKGINDGDIPLSERYLAKKEPEEYGNKIQLDINQSVNEKDKQALEEFHKALKENIKERNYENQE